MSISFLCCCSIAGSTGRLGKKNAVRRRDFRSVEMSKDGMVRSLFFNHLIQIVARKKNYIFIIRIRDRGKERKRERKKEKKKERERQKEKDKRQKQKNKKK